MFFWGSTQPAAHPQPLTLRSFRDVWQTLSSSLICPATAGRYRPCSGDRFHSSPLVEPGRRALCPFPDVPRELFGLAAQRALELSARVIQARQHFVFVGRARLGTGPQNQERLHLYCAQSPSRGRDAQILFVSPPPPVALLVALHRASKLPPVTPPGTREGECPLLQPVTQRLASGDIRPLDAGNAVSGLQNLTPMLTAKIPWGQDHDCHQPREGPSPTPGDQGYSRQKGYQTTRQAYTARWILHH